MKKRILAKAINLATNAHKGQYDLGGQPYILHPLAVMHMLGTDDEELQAIAVMHDVIEDTQVTAHRLKYDFGFSDRVIDGVVALSKVDGQEYEDYLEQVLKNEDAIRVKMADLKHNSQLDRLRGIKDKDIARMGKYMKAYTRLKQALEK
tara:strand:+ start:99 stop:545 length:447 start_codon:yes stop_codon:yes gene_type:complete